MPTPYSSIHSGSDVDTAVTVTQGLGTVATTNSYDDLDDKPDLGNLESIAGDVVGTTDTQTLTNKTIDGANNTLTVPSSQVDSTLLDVTGTTHTAAASDDGKIYRLTNASGCTVTIPDTLSAGWSVGAVQVGNAQSTFAVSGSMVLTNRQSHTKTAGQYAAVQLIVQATNSVYLSGDTGT